MTDYAVKVSVRNGRILRAMRAKGFTTQQALADKAGISLQAVNQLIAMRARAMLATGDWSSNALAVAFALEVPPDELWTEAQSQMKLKTNSVEVDMSEGDVARLMDRSSEASSWARLEVDKLMVCLNDRERKLVQERLSGVTLDELAGEFGVGKARLHQIEIRAHRKMRGMALRDERDARFRMLEQ